VRRREFIALVGGAVAWPFAGHTQQAARIRLIGAIPLGPNYGKAFRESLDKLGWTEGRNVRSEYRYVSGDVSRIRADVAELVALAPEVILSAGTETTTALQQTTRTIPIVFVHVADPLSAGLVQSLAYPGSNLTGFTSHESSIGAKWLEVLKEIAPRVTQVLVLVDPQNSTWPMHVRTIEAAASSLSVQLTVTHVSSAAEIERTIESFAGKPNGGVVVLPSLLIRDEGEQIIALTNRHRMPAICSFHPFVTSGLLVSYSADWLDLYRRAASYVDRILKGEKPAGLPVQQPIKYELIINLKTAKAIGVEVPPTLLARADEVIE
jgi:putative ABC transport system substrate-binding protein